MSSFRYNVSSNILVKDIVFYLGILGLLLSPINISIFFNIRLSEFFFITAFFLGLPFFKLFFYYLLFFFIFSILYLASSVSGLINGGGGVLDIFFFFYKYFFIFILYFISLVISSKSIYYSFFQKVIAIVFIFMVFWSIFYSHLLSYVYDGGINVRVSFPSNLGFVETDAHLYSFCLGFLLFYFYNNLRTYFKVGVFYSTFIMLLGVYALYLTGSRTGLFVFFIIQAFFSIFLTISRLQRSKPRVIKLKPRDGIFAILFCGFFLYIVVQFSPYFIHLILDSRAFNLDFQNDPSSLSRLAKFFVAVNDYGAGFYVFGVGPVFSTYTWYDGIFSIILVHLGPFGLFFYLFLYLIAIYFVLSSKISFQNRLFLLTCIAYLFICLCITEYILVSRGASLVLLPLFVLLNRYAFKSVHGRLD